jgi:hypothetical protein
MCRHSWPVVQVQGSVLQPDALLGPSYTEPATQHAFGTDDLLMLGTSHSKTGCSGLRASTAASASTSSAARTMEGAGVAQQGGAQLYMPTSGAFGSGAAVVAAAAAPGGGLIAAAAAELRRALAQSACATPALAAVCAAPPFAAGSGAVCPQVSAGNCSPGGANVSLTRQRAPSSQCTVFTHVAGCSNTRTRVCKSKRLVCGTSGAGCRSSAVISHTSHVMPSSTPIPGSTVSLSSSDPQEIACGSGLASISGSTAMFSASAIATPGLASPVARPPATSRYSIHPHAPASEPPTAAVSPPCRSPRNHSIEGRQGGHGRAGLTWVPTAATISDHSSSDGICRLQNTGAATVSHPPAECHSCLLVSGLPAGV